MMTSPNGNILHVTGSLWGNPSVTGGFPHKEPVTCKIFPFDDVIMHIHIWIPLTKASDAELWCFLRSASEQTVEQAIQTPPHYAVTVMVWSGGYKANFLRSAIFRFFQHCQTTRKLLNITFIFGRCRRSSAAVTPVKYGCDSKNLTCTFARSKFLLTEKITNGVLVTPTPDGVSQSRIMWYISQDIKGSTW